MFCVGYVRCWICSVLDMFGFGYVRLVDMFGRWICSVLDMFGWWICSVWICSVWIRSVADMFGLDTFDRCYSKKLTLAVPSNVHFGCTGIL